MHRYQRRALVAGGAGFLGSHLCDRLLADGMEVVALDDLSSGTHANLANCRDDVRFGFVAADVAAPLPRGIATGRFDEIYNLACVAPPPSGRADPDRAMMTSVVGTRQLLRLAEASEARFLLASTGEIYGDRCEQPQAESCRGSVNPVGPRACYDEGRRAAEALAADGDRRGRTGVRIARVFDTYGPRLPADDGQVVAALILQALAGLPLAVYGNGAQAHCFCFVRDVVDGLVRLMRHAGPQPGPVNLGNPAAVTILDLAQRIDAMVVGHGVMVRLPRAADAPRHPRPDIARAARLIGWAPTTGLDEGLAATIAWFADHRPASTASAASAASNVRVAPIDRAAPPPRTAAAA